MKTKQHWCAVCGGELSARVVRNPDDGTWKTIVKRHVHYGQAMRVLPEGFVKKQFEAMREAVESAVPS